MRAEAELAAVHGKVQEQNGEIAALRGKLEEMGKILVQSWRHPSGVMITPVSYTHLRAHETGAYL
eukprot:1494817-Pyramimonas_sp.AAC.1